MESSGFHIPTILFPIQLPNINFRPGKSFWNLPQGIPHLRLPSTCANKSDFHRD
ncbi:hypothetical protein ACJ72_01803 [Emergomyces africanus]|uniref:Uncharacterized protein n=1 Tax=Emergomyces africanus TaxID=1955775 RepID=A0A1B7P468_9EURO|nr:hypothetical protein ACJ72_01803 [Emergomyces africanus]